MIFIVNGGTTEQKNLVVTAIAQLADRPVYRRSVMQIPLMALKESNDVKSQFIVDICNNYIGDTLKISEERAGDRRHLSLGDEKSMNESKRPSKKEIEKTVVTIANSLCEGAGNNFLLNTVLKKICPNKNQIQVFVDIQYKEELQELVKYNSYNKKVTIININGESKCKLLPKIKGYNLFNDTDLSDFKQITISAQSSLKDIANSLSTLLPNGFLLSIVDKDSEKGVVEEPTIEVDFEEMEMAA